MAAIEMHHIVKTYGDGRMGVYARVFSPVKAVPETDVATKPFFEYRDPKDQWWAKVSVDDKALDAVPVSVAPPGAGDAAAPGMPGMPHGMAPGMPMNHPPMSAPGTPPPPPPAPATK